MNLLFLSWRDINHPRKGGAEVFTHECMTRLVAAGHTVTHLSPRAENTPQEWLDGVKYIRRGNMLTVLWHAFLVYRKGNFDRIIEQCNTHQFLSWMYAKRAKRMFFIHQLTRELWFHNAWFPLSVAGYLAEPVLLWLQRKTPTWTVSHSTAQGLRAYGFKDITVLPEGLNFPAWNEAEFLPKSDMLTLLYVGRVVPYKGIFDAIKAVQILHKQGVECRLDIIGKGPKQYEKKLQRYIQKQQLGEYVTFRGYVTHEEKLTAMSRAHLLLVPSRREGWGLIVTEANAVGTIAVAYDSPGLRDSVRHGVTGVLTAHRTAASLAYHISALWAAPLLRNTLAQNAHAWAKTFSWDNAGRAMNDALLP